MIPFDINHSILEINSFSDIASVDHHPAVFFTQSGTFSDVLELAVSPIIIISSLIKNSIALTNSFSDIASVDHHPAVFFTQSGTFSAYAFDEINEMNKSAKKHDSINFIKYFDGFIVLRFFDGIFILIQKHFCLK